MFRVIPVQNLDLSELAPYRTMRRQVEQREQGIFVAEGEKVVRRLLESRLEIVSLLLPEKWAKDYEHLLTKRPEMDLPVFTAEKALLERLIGFSMYQGVHATAKVPPEIPLERILDRSTKPRLIVAVDGISSAENLGGLVRNCTAFGVQALVVGETCCSPYLRRAVRSSMGTIFKLPVIETVSLKGVLEMAKARGLHLIAAHPHTDERLLAQADFATDCIIVLGSEGTGISAPVLELCDEWVAIPMQNEVDSLNVGTAGAVFRTRRADSGNRG